MHQNGTVCCPLTFTEYLHEPFCNKSFIYTNWLNNFTFGFNQFSCRSVLRFTLNRASKKCNSLGKMWYIGTQTTFFYLSIRLIDWIELSLVSFWMPELVYLSWVGQLYHLVLLYLFIRDLVHSELFGCCGLAVH
jgi:hypothetical protein